MSSLDIASRQNEPIMLKVQYAARCCYNLAEIQNYFVWFFCLLSAFSVFLPDDLPCYLSAAIPFAADIIAWCLMRLVDRNVQMASDLRRYFDAYSMNINLERYSEGGIRRLTEISNEKVTKNPEKARIQMDNTGNDTPPGVRDWYMFSRQYEGLEAQFECQRQNTWWDRKLFPIKNIATWVVFGIVIVIFFVLMRWNGFFYTLLCSAGLLTKLGERIYDNRKYIILSNQIDGSLQTVEARLTVEGINQLQTLIDERRAVNILGINFLHKIKARVLTNKYNDLSNPH